MLYIRKNKGFTLIEILVVIGMLSVIALAIYATFSNGVRIWQRLNVEMPEEDLNIFIDRFARDARNGLLFTGVDFIGTEDRVEMPTLVNDAVSGDRTIGKAIYRYDSGEKSLKREERDFSQVYKGQDGRVTFWLDDVTSVRFTYYFYSETEEKYYWKEKWQQEGLPLAVRLELELDDGDGSIFKKTVSIPSAG